MILHEVTSWVNHHTSYWYDPAFDYPTFSFTSDMMNCMATVRTGLGKIALPINNSVN